MLAKNATNAEKDSSEKKDFALPALTILAL
jgi:hypothetical protein